MSDDASPSPDLPAWLCGSWRREWIHRRGGARSSAVEVHYLQTPELFADLRVARSRPRILASSLAEATDVELAALAEQQGFAGVATLNGDVVTWHHALDFQPTSPSEVDAGRVERVGGAMFEHALDAAYVELWWRVASGDGRFLAVERRVGARLEALFLVAGDAFVFARSRAVELPAARSLGELVADPDIERETKLAYLDCEISAGRARGGRRPWEIDRSTFPWREGGSIDVPFVVQGGELALHEGWTLRTSTLPIEALAVGHDQGAG